MKIKLPNNQYALADDGDSELLSSYEWRLDSKGYAISRGSNPVYMHRLILNAPRGKDVDHINHNPLDNRRENLRLCSHADNLRASAFRKQSTTGFTGVSERNGKYRAYANVNNKPKHLGYFDTAVKAAKVRDAFVKGLYGEFATLNFR